MKTSVKYTFVHQKEDTTGQAYRFGITPTFVKNHHRYYLLGVYSDKKTAIYWAKGDKYNPNGFVKTVTERQRYPEQPLQTAYAVYTYYPQEE